MSTVQKIEQENKYEILQNEAGEILIIINVRDGGPEKPRFVYDGGSEALLYRSREKAVVFKTVAEEARLPLKSVNKLTVVEIDGDFVAREYEVPVRIIKDVKSLIK